MAIKNFYKDIANRFKPSVPLDQIEVPLKFDRPLEVPESKMDVHVFDMFYGAIMSRPYPEELHQGRTNDPI